MEKRITIENKAIKAPFKIPEGYFEKMEAEILNKISEEKIVKLPVEPKINWRKWSIAAAALLVVFIGLYFAQITTQINNSDADLSEITEKQMVQYLENENIDLADISEKFEKNELENIVEENLELDPIEIDDKALNQIEAKYLN